MKNETLQYLQTLIPEKIGTKRPQSRNPDNYYTTVFVPTIEEKCS